MFDPRLVKPNCVWAESRWIIWKIINKQLKNLIKYSKIEKKLLPLKHILAVSTWDQLWVKYAPLQCYSLSFLTFCKWNTLYCLRSITCFWQIMNKKCRIFRDLFWLLFCFVLSDIMLPRQKLALFCYFVLSQVPTCKRKSEKLYSL